MGKFVYIMAVEGPVFVNIDQIAFVTGIKEDGLSLHMTSGDQLTFHARVSDDFISLICAYATLSDGTPLKDVLDRDDLPELPNAAS